MGAIKLWVKLRPHSSLKGHPLPFFHSFASFGIISLKGVYCNEEIDLGNLTPEEIKSFTVFN